MAEIVNLRRARKRREREAAAQSAQENRALFGRTKAEKAGTTAETRQVQRALDGAALDKDETPRKD